MKKITKSLGAAALAVSTLLAATPSATAATAEPVDASVRVLSNAPVPGLMTAGQFVIRNEGTTTIKVNAKFRVTFEDLRGTTSLSKHTVTCSTIARCNVVADPHNDHSYIVTLTTRLAPGEQTTGLWSNHHFLNGTRDRVIMTTESLDSTQTDVRSANNSSVYDNWGKGF